MWSSYEGVERISIGAGGGGEGQQKHGSNSQLQCIYKLGNGFK